MRATRLFAAAGLIAGLLVGVAALAGAADARDAPCITTLCVPPPPAGSPPPASPDPTPTTTTTTPAPMTTTTAPPPTSTDARRTLLTDLNRERIAAGVSPLSERSDVDVIAATWSVHLANAGRLSHDEDYFTATTRQRLDGWALGENVAYAGSPEAAHSALMASPPHKANILDSRFTVIGLGAEYRDGTWWVTEDFLQPAERASMAGAPSDPIHPALAPTTRAQPAASATTDTAQGLNSASPPAALVTATAVVAPRAQPSSFPVSPDETPTTHGAIRPIVAGTLHRRDIRWPLADALLLAGWITLEARRRHSRRLPRPART